MENKHQSYDLAQMQSLPLDVKLIMTRRRIREWYEEFDGDVSFPEVNMEEWNITEKIPGLKDEKNPYDYSYVTYERK